PISFTIMRRTLSSAIKMACGSRSASFSPGPPSGLLVGHEPRRSPEIPLPVRDYDPPNVENQMPIFSQAAAALLQVLGRNDLPPTTPAATLAGRRSPVPMARASLSPRYA